MRIATAIVGKKKKKRKVITGTFMGDRILAIKIYQNGKICPDQDYSVKLLAGKAENLDELAQAGWKLVTISSYTTENYASFYAYLEKGDL